MTKTAAIALAATAAADPVAEVIQRILPWAGSLVGVVLVFAAGWSIYRKRMIQDQQADRPLWSLQELRDMHARGELQDEEFERLKARVIEQSGASAGKPARDPSGGAEA